MRLIYATKAIESIDEIVCSMSVCINSDYYNGMRAMKDMTLHVIEKQPTVDAVEVVRCEDCKWFDISEPSGTVEPIGYRCKRRWIFVDIDDFCKRGERRE